MRCVHAILLAASLCATPAFALQQVFVPHVSHDDVISNVQPPDEASKACQLDSVAAFQNRVHVQCINTTGGDGLHSAPDLSANGRAGAGLWYFAVDVQADPGLANRVVELGASAIEQNAHVTVFFRTNPAENPPGCLPADCRRLTGLVRGR
jgi:hypothetical protein